jgi:hypothetical protein
MGEWRVNREVLVGKHEVMKIFVRPGRIILKLILMKGINWTDEAQVGTGVGRLCMR